MAAKDRWQERIGRRIRLRDLHILLTVVQSGSMAKAARLLSVSQPAISKAVTGLEHALGVQLLDRSSRGVESTAYCDALVGHALVVFDELRQAVEQLEFISNPCAGEVRMGCNDSLSVALLPALINRLATQYPEISLNVHRTSNPITLDVERLRRREIDFIVGRGVFEIPEGDLLTEVLFEEALIVVAGVHSEWTRRRKLRLEDLTLARWILSDTEIPPGILVADAFRARGLQLPRARVTTSSFHLRETLLATGNYLTVVPACMLPVFNARGAIVKALSVDLGLAPRPVAVFRLKHRTMNPAAERVIGAVREAARAMASR